MNAPSKTSQHGVITLGVSLMLLLIGSLAVMSASKVVFFSQKASVSSYHYTQAFAAATAGVERGLTYLGRASGSGITQSSLYDSDTLKLKPAAFPIKETLPESKSGYTITMTQPNQADDPLLIEIKSTGCADSQATCPTAGNPEATVTQLVKFRPLLVGQPLDALLVRGTVDLKGNVTVKNQTGVGVAIRAAGTVSVGNGSSAGTIVRNYAPLAGVTPAAFFESLFGDTKAAIQGYLPNLAADFPAAGTGGAFWIEGDTAIHGGTFGSPSNPVILIVNGNLRLNGNTTIYGLLYVIGGTSGWNNQGGGTGEVVGATVSEGDFSAQGTPDFIKDKDVLGNLKALASVGKVVGSWKDF